MRLIHQKILLLSLLFLLGFVSGISPYLLRNRCMTLSQRQDKFVSFLNCFSAGVFCATFFMHMMPEAQEEFSSVFGDLDYPFAELLLSTGFFFVMVVEQTVMNWYESKQQKDKFEETNGNSNSFDARNNNSVASPLAPAIDSNVNYNSLTSFVKSQSSVSFRHRLNESVSTTFSNLQCCEDNLHDEIVDINLAENIKVAEISKPVEDASSRDALQPREGATDSSDHHTHFDPHIGIRALILLFALSTHALFEGLAIGFQTSVSSLTSLMVAVVIHKMALAFSLGISLVNNQAKLINILISMFIFSVMAPVGIGIGTALNSFKSANHTVGMVVALMQAFAAGTFVYIIFIEIIPHEFVSSKSENRLWKLFCLGIGFAGMAAVQAIPHEE